MKSLASRKAIGLFAASCAAAAILTATPTSQSATPLLSVPPGATLTIRSSVTDAQGDPITYRWASTDGYVRNVNRATTTWTLPAKGIGIHYLYLQASDGKGGYTEQRVIVATDGRSVAEVENESSGRLSHPSAPPAPAMVGSTSRTWVPDQVPDVRVRLVQDPPNPNAPAAGDAPRVSPVLTSSLKGELVIPELDTGATGGYTSYDIYCNIGADPDITNPAQMCGTTNLDGPAQATEATGHYGFNAFSNNGPAHFPGSTAVIDGFVKRADGSVCGLHSSFFGNESAATVAIYDAAGTTLLGGPSRVNTFGQYQVPANLPISTTAGAIVRATCEGAPVMQQVIVADTSTALPASQAVQVRGPDFTLTNTAPVVNSLIAYYQGTPVFWPAAPTGRPSDLVPAADQFLTGRGVDTRMDACQYYKAIGVVAGCDANGNLIGGITFDQWKQRTQMAPYNKNPEYHATYVNTVDLNLTRDHHATRVGPGQISSYVCNYVGPADPTQQALVDGVVADALNGKHLVACVAMDYDVTPGVNGDKPFTKFTTFGPDGNLLVSVNLDGRGEKFTPGNCVACHGGEKYVGNFSVGAAGKADLGAHFLPYDADNFAYSSVAGLTRADQEAAIKSMNQLVLETAPSDATAALINGWYGGCTLQASGYACTNATLDGSYLPPDWRAGGYVAGEILGTHPTTSYPGFDQTQADALAASLYRDVIKASCRTCHTAATAQYNLDLPSGWNNSPRTGFDLLQYTVTTPAMIAGTPEWGRLQTKAHWMPNALVTFNRFWGSVGTAVDQPSIIVSAFGNSWSDADPMTLITAIPDIDFTTGYLFWE